MNKLGKILPCMLLVCLLSLTNIFAQTTTNDECVDAIPIPVNTDGSCDLSATGTSGGATFSSSAGPVDPACFAGSFIPKDIWFSFQVPASGSVNISYGPAHEPLPTFTLIDFYTGSCGSLVSHPILGCGLPTAPVTGLTPGETVFVRTWDLFGILTYTFDICVGDPIIGCTDPCATNYDPLATIDDGSCSITSTANATCATAIPITAGSYDFIADGNLPVTNTAFCGGFDSVGVYYSYVVPAGVDTIEVLTCTDAFHGKEVSIGCGSSVTILGCTNSGATTNCIDAGVLKQRSIARVPVTGLAGTTLTIRINANDRTEIFCGTLVVTEFGSGCDSSNPPTNLTHLDDTPPGNVTLNWDPVPNSIGCQVRGTRISPAGPSPSVNILGFEPTSAQVPYSVAGGGTTWEWVVRCACDLGAPPDATGFSAPDVFSVPLLRTAVSEFNLFPNPANEQITVSISRIEDRESEVIIADISGRILEIRTLASGTDRFTINVSDYANGLYSIRVDGVDSRKFEVVH